MHYPPGAPGRSYAGINYSEMLYTSKLLCHSRAERRWSAPALSSLLRLQGGAGLMVVTMYSVASRMASLIRLLLYLAAPTACVRHVEALSDFGLSRRFSPGLGVVLRPRDCSSG